MCFVDIVLNYTSSNSKWILNCNNAVYNEYNMPILRCAIELDEALF